MDCTHANPYHHSGLLTVDSDSKCTFKSMIFAVLTIFINSCLWSYFAQIESCEKKFAYSFIEM